MADGTIGGKVEGTLDCAAGGEAGGAAGRFETIGEPGGGAAAMSELEGTTLDAGFFRLSSLGFCGIVLEPPPDT
jgi:hypothetical protein